MADAVPNENGVENKPYHSNRSRGSGSYSRLKTDRGSWKQNFPNQGRRNWQQYNQNEQPFKSGWRQRPSNENNVGESNSHFNRTDVFSSEGPSRPNSDGNLEQKEHRPNKWRNDRQSYRNSNYYSSANNNQEHQRWKNRNSQGRKNISGNSDKESGSNLAGLPDHSTVHIDQQNLLQHIAERFNPDAPSTSSNFSPHTDVEPSSQGEVSQNNRTPDEASKRYDDRKFGTRTKYYNANRYDERPQQRFSSSKYSKDGRAFNRKQDHVFVDQPFEGQQSHQSSAGLKYGNSGSSKFYSRREGYRKPNYSYSSKETSKDEDDSSQRDRLIDQLARNACECMVCCDVIRTHDSIWSCQNCFHVFHLRCIRKWARSPAAIVEDSGWRCPACQNLTEKVPKFYFCFCGKLQDPEWNHYDTPHSCGEPCGRKRKFKDCIHPCNILCHPGPCPPCEVQVTRSCECGKTKQPIWCGHSDAILCTDTCDKILNCKVHFCNNKCHIGPCQECQVKFQQVCWCGKNNKEVVCTLETAGISSYSCNSVCEKLLDCGNHKCQQICHEGPCKPCTLSPVLVTTCPCGQVKLSELLSEDQQRKTCLDPIPSCGNVCKKLLSCGSADNPHFCQAVCHSGPCPSCQLTATIRCTCGFQTKEIPCAELNSMGQFTCEKRCNKKRQCGRHKCLQKCCVDTEHKCDLVCSRKLSCGLHTCEEPCHRGNCPTCWHTSFDELACHCGATIMYPPIPCGTKPPECNQSCNRIHSCDHPVFHNCHSEEKCPPCTFLTEKWCYGHHELRSNVPCYLNEISCGRPCGKQLPCGQHKCQLICHAGPCLKDNVQCTQPCPKERPACGHPCGVPCHLDTPCPETSCKTKVDVTCQCGHITGTLTCAENMRLIQKNLAIVMASKMNEIQAGESVDISELNKITSSDKNKRLECTEECAMLDRNRRLALALQIRNPDISNKLGPPAYSDFLKEQMKSNPTLVTSIYNKLTELVQSAKQSKQKSRSHAFPPMNRDHRRVIHEMAEFFGCETQSYDEEPKKNVVATALRDKSWLPSVSIMTLVQRESTGPRKAPPPIPHHKNQQLNKDDAESQNSKSGTQVLVQSSQKKEPVIDYFDYENN